MSDNENVSMRKRTSLVWQYFEKLSSSRVKCRICQHEQRYMGNTANALRHLNVKHEIDARSKGLEDPENVKRMRALSSSAALDKTIAAIKSENWTDYNVGYEEDLNEGRIQRSSRHNTRYVSDGEEETEVDPFSTDNEMPLLDFVESINDSRKKSKKLGTSTEKQCANNSSSTNRRKTLEEKRIMAETEYYREKAAYFRIQKHLAALQAKKAKFELEQMYGNKI